MKLKDVKELMLEKKDLDGMLSIHGIASPDVCIGEGYNSAISALGNKEICIDVEKVRQELFKWATSGLQRSALEVAQTIANADIITVVIHE